MGAQNTLIDILTSVVVCEFVSSAAARFPLTPKRSLCVYTKQAEDAVVIASQALVDILTVHTVLFELVSIETATTSIPQTQLRANRVFAVERIIFGLCCNVAFLNVLFKIFYRRFSGLFSCC